MQHEWHTQAHIDSQNDNIINGFEAMLSRAPDARSPVTNLARNKHKNFLALADLLCEQKKLKWLTKLLETKTWMTMVLIYTINANDKNTMCGRVAYDANRR